jgi:hypothetical protein
MRSLPFAVAAVLFAETSARALAAQTPGEPNLVLTIFGGVQAGHALWTVQEQPLCVLDSQGRCGSVYDTLRLSRSVGSSIVAGVTATYFVSPHVGLTGHLGYQGFSLNDGCTAVVLSADAERRNEQLCDDIRGSQVSGGAVSVLAGVTVRAAPRGGGISPYVQAGAGLVNHGRSTTDVAGRYVAGGTVVTREVIADDSPLRTSVGLLVGGGFTSPLGTGYQFRLEVRDIVSRLQRLEGPADPLGRAPKAIRFYHSIALTMGLGIVLENTRGRRY